MPTATQSVDVTQESPWSAPPVGLGLGVTDQATPFQDSTSVFTFPVVLPVSPTATQLACPVHETALSSPPLSPLFGPETIDQSVPFHFSMSM